MLNKNLSSVEYKNVVNKKGQKDLALIEFV